MMPIAHFTRRSPTRRQTVRAAHALAVTVLIVASATRQASAQTAVQQSTDPTARLAQRLDADTHASVMKVVESAKEQELPIEPIVSKALLGATFRQPGAVITQSVNVVLQRLVASRDALAPTPTPRDIAAGATAIELGVPSKTIHDLRSRFPDRSMVVPLAVLGELVANKVPVNRAAEMVRDLMRRGASENQLVAFSDKVREDIARGTSPSEAITTRIQGLIALLPTAPPVAGAAGDNAFGSQANSPPRRP
jgi:hypothetical protein